MIPGLTKSYEAAVAVEGHLIAKFAAPGSDSTVTEAAANTDALIGVFAKFGADADSMADVVMSGIYGVKLGGTVQAGQLLSSDANGAGIAAAAVASTTVRTLGIALEPGVSGDIIDVFLSPGVINQG